MCPGWFKDERASNNNVGDFQKQKGKSEHGSISEANKILPSRMSLEAGHGGTCPELQDLRGRGGRIKSLRSGVCAYAHERDISEIQEETGIST